MSRTGRTVAISAAILLALMVLAPLLAPILVEPTIRAELANRGVDGGALDTSLPALAAGSVRSVRIGRDGAFAADEIAIEYRIAELIHGRIDRIRLNHPTLHVSVTDDGKLSFGDLDPLLQENGAASGGFLLPAPIEIIDGSVTAETPSGGPMTARLSGAVSLEPGAGPLKIDISGPWLSAELAISLNPNGSALALSGRVMQARVTHPLISIDSLTGDVNSILGNQATRVSADFTLKNVSSPLLSLGSGETGGDLSVGYDQGMLTGKLRLAGSDGSLESRISGDPAQRLRVALRGENLAVPEKLKEASLNAVLDLDPNSRRALLTEPARIEARLAPELRAALPEMLNSTLTDAPLTLTAQAGLAASRTESGSTVVGRFALAQQSTLAASFDGSLNQSEAGISGSTDLRVDMPKLALAGAVLEKPSLNAPLQIATESSRTQIRLRGPAPLSAAAARFGTTRIAKFIIPFQPSEQPLLAFGPQTLSFDLTAGPGKGSGQFGDERQPFAFEWKGATLTGSSGSTPKATLTGGRMTLPRGGWQASGIDVQWNADEGSSTAPEIRFSIAELGQDGNRPVLAPLAIKGTIRPTDTLLRFDLDGQGAGGRVHLMAKGSHDVTRNRGTAALALDPLQFEQSGLQPGTVSPMLGDVLTGATGS